MHLFFFRIDVFVFISHVWVLGSMCMCAPYTYSAFRGQKRVSNLLYLKPQMTGSWGWNLGPLPKPWVLLTPEPFSSSTPSISPKNKFPIRLFWSFREMHEHFITRRISQFLKDVKNDVIVIKHHTKLPMKTCATHQFSGVKTGTSLWWRKLADRMKIWCWKLSFKIQY